MVGTTIVLGALAAKATADVIAGIKRNRTQKEAEADAAKAIAKEQKIIDKQGGISDAERKQLESAAASATRAAQTRSNELATQVMSGLGGASGQANLGRITKEAQAAAAESASKSQLEVSKVATDIAAQRAARVADMRAQLATLKATGGQQAAQAISTMGKDAFNMGLALQQLSASAEGRGVDSRDVKVDSPSYATPLE